MAEKDIRQYSLEELEKLTAKGEHVPTPSDAPVFELDDDFWNGACVVMPHDKSLVHIPVDADILEWFKAQGEGHIGRMHAVLRSYVDAHKQDSH